MCGRKPGCEWCVKRGGLWVSSSFIFDYYWVKVHIQFICSKPFMYRHNHAFERRDKKDRSIPTATIIFYSHQPSRERAYLVLRSSVCNHNVACEWNGKWGGLVLIIFLVSLILRRTMRSLIFLDHSCAGTSQNANDLRNLDLPCTIYVISVMFLQKMFIITVLFYE